MFDPIVIKFSNLFTHEHTVYDFKKDELTLIVGENCDVPGANSNGSGKSGLPEAIYLAVTGEVHREVGKSDFIRRGEEQCVVNLTLCDSITKDFFIIHREIFAGNKSSTLDLLETVNGKEVPVKEFGSENKMKRTAQQYIYYKLGTNKEDFGNYFCISQDNDTDFFESTDTKQKEIISRFSNYNKVEKIVTQINLEIAQVQQEQFKLTTKIESRKLTVHNLEESIIQLKNSNSIAVEKTSLTEQIINLRSKVEIGDNKAAALQAEQVSLNKELQALKKALKTKQTLPALKLTLQTLRDLNDANDDTLNDIKEVKSQLAVRNGKIVACPKCKWEFIPGENMTTKEIHESKKVVELEETKIREAILLTANKIIVAKQQIKQFDEIVELEQQLAAKQTRLTDIEIGRKSLMNMIAQRELDLKNLKQNSATQKLIEDQQTKIAIYNEEIKTDTAALELLVVEREALVFQEFSFSKQFRTFVANKTIRVIQDMVNYYLKLFEVEMNVLINGYTVNKNGDIREKLQIWVLKQGGREKCLFKGLSGGERARISLCGIIALHKLLLNASDNKGINLLLIDEHLSGLDAIGQAEVIEILERAQMTSLIIMHNVEDIQVKNRLVIRKENGISKIVENE